ncbi:glutamine--fructose-6-phosphate aminotransferase [Candidatus Gottesmanbacteria bacterium RIFCSPLOWO2_01_FULL_39_12b]|uniref:Glutamine--fructose-6-phosphate aminotransferase [isomerizing] n=1 Tax=Candidatus Gottesmanbacteria bacterium RIFCSPLOWO2_01_FULL_39_12b TaxID=1798388 RepID=A0A1F6APY6_9BACT|nr:MAG: glutamine--fructose-6-phosphate aminotransferase [Candidatus Gottesmanbacteria bacterium RIFCSPLOWO2_01_FULL_39_12b]
MCGIFGYIGKSNKASEIVFNGLKTLEYRGYDSWGIATLKSKITVKKRVGKIGNANVDDLPKSNFALGHTRWATHGGVTEVNAHPHLDCSGQFAIIHNGIIENYDEIKEELLKKKHKIVSDTDTEVAVHLIEEIYRKSTGKSKKENFLEATRKAFNRFVGLNAIIVMDAETSTYVAAKNGSPLAIGKGSNENFLASDAHALIPYTKNIYFMEDGEIISVTPENISIFDALTGRKKTLKFNKLTWKQTAIDKGKYPHFMLKEIFDQPKVIENIINDSKFQIINFSDIIKNSYGTYLVGCGTAAYACLAGTYIFSKISGRHLNFSVGSEFGYLVDFLTPKSLVIALSQSGETIDVIDSVKKAKVKGAQITSLVNSLGSTLYRLSDKKLLLNAGVERAVVSTKAFTAKLTVLILLAYQLAGKISEGKSILRECLKVLKEVLCRDNLNRIRKLVKTLVSQKHIYIIGRGVSYPIALEAALKIKEASYIHAEGFAAGELKHGVIALIEKNIPCIAFLPNDETYGATLAGCMEMKARGGYIIGISHKNHEVFDYYLPVYDVGIASIIPSAVVGQLLGYYLAIEQGLDPDKPRNLAKSVTVR